MADLVVEIEPSTDKHVVIILPHAHVVPTAALAAISLAAVSAHASPPTAKPNGSHDRDLGRGQGQDQGQDRQPTISVVQLPCCKFTKHDTMFGARADFEYVAKKTLFSHQKHKI